MKKLLLILLFICGAAYLSADEFKFTYLTGDKYRIVSTVDEDVFIDRIFSHSAKVINRIAFSVGEQRQDGAVKLSGDFSTSTKYTSGFAYVSDKIYKSEYWLLSDGRYEIAPEYYMPTVRNIPTFPAAEINIGDTWTAPAEERHDFRSDFGIPEPYVIPIAVNYTYEKPVEIDGKTFKCIKASYTIKYLPTKPSAWRDAYPTQIAGYSDQILYWDAEKGGIAAYSEHFKFVFDLSNGRVVEYRGKAESKIVEAELMDRPALEKAVRDAVSTLDDITVTSDERGVTISLDNIQFEPNSNKLRASEIEKIKRIAAILAELPNRDIQVSGHTALAGTVAGRKKLSTERAAAVADELIRLGVRKSEEITVIGYGAEKPIADNSTDEGRVRNRRVEITILEN